MKLVKLMLSEFVKYIKHNIITALLMSVVSLMLIIFFSLYVFQKSKLAPFTSMNIKNGFFIAGNATEMDLDKTDGITDVYKIYNTHAIDENTKTTGYILGYESWTWENWKASLKSGNWFTKHQINECAKEGLIPAIFDGHNGQYKVGDVVEIYNSLFYYDDTERPPFRFKVVGLLNDDAGVVAATGEYHAADLSYESLYKTYNDLVTEEGQFLLIIPVDKEAAKEMALYGNQKMFLQYDDNLSADAIEEVNVNICKQISGEGIPYNEFISESKKLLSRTILTYIPFILIGGTILFISMYAMSYLTVAKSLKHVAIYTIIGSSRRDNFIIILGNVLGTILFSIIFFMIGLNIYKEYAISHQLVFVLIDNYLLIVGISYVAFVLFMSFTLYLAFRKKTMRNMLISLHK